MLEVIGVLSKAGFIEVEDGRMKKFSLPRSPFHATVGEKMTYVYMSRETCKKVESRVVVCRKTGDVNEIKADLEKALRNGWRRPRFEEVGDEEGNRK